MNITKIALTAALLALQAAALSLLHAGEACATHTVHRCQGGYQQAPCPPGQHIAQVRVADGRTLDQQQQAHAQRTRDLRAYRHLLHQRTQAIKQAPKPRAVALTQVRPGDTPFARDPAFGASSTAPVVVKAHKKPVYVVKVPAQPHGQQVALD